MTAFWAAGIEDIFIDGSFCTEKLDPGDVDGYWVEPDDAVYDRIDPHWIDFEMILVLQVRQWKWRMWADHAWSFSSLPPYAQNRWSGFRSFSGRIEKGCRGA